MLNQATKILLSDSAGPVLLSFPYNVQKELVDDSILDNIKTEKHLCALNKDSGPVNTFVELTQQAKNPVIIAGYGCIKSGAQERLTELSKLLNIPVTSSLKGKGAISEQSELSLGSLGVTSYSHAYKYIEETADLVIFLGAAFNERTSYLWDKKLLKGKKIIQVDSDYGQLEKVFKTDIAIQGDIKEVLTAVLDNINNYSAENVLKEYIPISNADNPETESNARTFKNRFSLIETFFLKLEEKFYENITVFYDNIIFAQNFYNVSSNNRY
mgnify:CR=1 FL=1